MLERIRRGLNVTMKESADDATLVLLVEITEISEELL